MDVIKGWPDANRSVSGTLVTSNDQLCIFYF
jgi:hypothetical protein